MLASGKRKIVFKPTESTGGLSALQLPCGQCIGCRLDYSRNWAIRLMYENQLHDESCFITLTYDDEHLPLDFSLDKREFQLFMKKLRRHFSGRKIRFFHAGEYGENYGRPHYHALLFGVSFTDKIPLKKTESGSYIWSSATLSQLWGKGYCSIGEVTFESAAYVARYCLKKVTGQKKEEVDEIGLRVYERLDPVTGEVHEVLPEYVTMSRRPGIAKAWYEKFKSDVYPHGYTVARGGIKMPAPRYFDKLYECENPIDMVRIKKLRLSRSNRREAVWNDVLKKTQMLDVNRPERLEVMEEVKESSLKLCKKKL